MAENTKNIRNGNKILFVGGPEAGNVRIVPESEGDMLAAGDYVYKIWPFQMQGHTAKMFFAYAADQHPMNLLLELWREYSPAAQIRRDATEAITYQKAGK